jgi:hypothetical protein
MICNPEELRRSADSQLADPMRRARTLFQLMRWSGLAIRDALTLPKDAIIKTAKGLYRVTTNRQRTGTHVSVPIPPKVAEEILAVPNDGPLHLLGW